MPQDAADFPDSSSGSEMDFASDGQEECVREVFDEGAAAGAASEEEEEDRFRQTVAALSEFEELPVKLPYIRRAGVLAPLEKREAGFNCPHTKRVSLRLGRYFLFVKGMQQLCANPDTFCSEFDSPESPTLSAKCSELKDKCGRFLSHSTFTTDEILAGKHFFKYAQDLETPSFFTWNDASNMLAFSINPVRSRNEDKKVREALESHVRLCDPTALVPRSQEFAMVRNVMKAYVCNIAPEKQEAFYRENRAARKLVRHIGKRGLKMDPALQESYV